MYNRRAVSDGNKGDQVVRMQLRLEDKAHWVKTFDPRDSTLFVATEAPPGVGASVRIDLAIADSGPRVILRGRVIARREHGAGSAPAGCSVALGAEEREKINYLNGFVRGGLLNLRERRRLPLRLPVTYGAVDGPCDTYTRDINEEGVFVVTEQPLPEDSEVHLLIRFPGRGQATSVNGHVSHTVVVEDEDIPGMGIVFALDDSRRDEFTALIDELEKRFFDGTLPDEILT